jgi:predicted alpha/beta-hydrolase family hydrolase
MPQPKSITLSVGSETVSGLFSRPVRAHACYVMAHGAGAGMDHPFMAAVADGLMAKGIATLRFQFPFMERGSKRVDGPALAHSAVRAAVQHAMELVPGLPLFAGGKSFGGRMTSAAQAEQAMPGLQGIGFIGFPLHPANKPSVKRAEHLASVALPMLFLQGTRDALAEAPLIESVVAALGDRATLHLLHGADHAFNVLVRSGRTKEAVMDELLSTLSTWISTWILDNR